MTDDGRCERCGQVHNPAGFCPPPVTRDPAAAVRLLHARRSKPDGYGMPSHYCREDGQCWPCGTIELLDTVAPEPTPEPTGEEPF